jgi:tyrosine-protein kinase Etk/Wzc
MTSVDQSVQSHQSENALDDQVIEQHPSERSETFAPTTLDALLLIAQQGKAFLAMPLFAGVVAAIASFMLPNVYTASAWILPPQQSSASTSALLSQLSGFASAVGVPVSVKNQSELYVALLQSRTIADRTISRFDLQSLYETDTMVQTRKELHGNLAVKAGKDGIIRIAFDDHEPERAAAIANALVEELDRLTQSLAVTEAGQRRVFFERQLKKAKEDLVAAELALKSTQEKTGLIQLGDQSRVIIEAVARLRAQIAAEEVRLNAMNEFATEQNPSYRLVEQNLRTLRTQLRGLQSDSTAATGELFVSTGKVPEAGLQFMRSFRDLKYAEAMYEVIAKQYEIAKAEEGQEAGIVQVVDMAVPPDRKSKPWRSLIVVGTVVGVAGLMLLWALARVHYLTFMADSLRASRVHALSQLLRQR